MQNPTEEPETGQIGTLAALVALAERKIAQGELLADMPAKALLDRECCEAAHKLNHRRPPCVMPICWDDHDNAWLHGQCWIDDRGRATDHAVPSMIFWRDLMDRERIWVRTIGVESARQIAMLLANQEARTTCLRALGLLSNQSEESDDPAERRRQYLRAAKTVGVNLRTMAFLPHDMSSPSMTEPAEVFQGVIQHLQADQGGVDMGAFFETERVGSR
jgi:hypothetical protein